MPRPTKPRWVEFVPTITYFKPAGVRMRDLEEVSLGVDEVEALRLKDLLDYEQEDCAKRMNLAQSTFQRILAGARQKVSKALIEGKALRIEGGNFLVSKPVLVCKECGLEWPDQRSGTKPVRCPSCGSPNIDESRSAPAGRECPRGGGIKNCGRPRADDEDGNLF